MLGPSKRMAFLDTIGRELQRRFTFAELDLYLKASRVKGLMESDREDSKWAYAKERLAGISDQDILKIARDLDLVEIDGSEDQPIFERPENWQEHDRFRLFLSHVSANKAKAHRLKDEFRGYGIHAFVAHDDIEPTTRWAEEIIKALHTMEAFVAVLSEGFQNSAWCNQETGFAIAKGIKTISFKMGKDDPPGFMGAEQALKRKSGEDAADAAEAIVRLLWKDQRTRERLREAFNEQNRIPARPMTVMNELKGR